MVEFYEATKTVTSVSITLYVSGYLSIYNHALAAWYLGIVSTCGVMGREIESRWSIGW
jgi:hypothetical protein